MDKDLRKKMQEAKSRCENKILAAIMEFSETTGLQVDDVHYQSQCDGEWISQSVEISTRI